jgi:peroxiredoxin
MAVEVGQEAPDFTLRDENNQRVHLADLRGQPVVLVFYPLDFSPVCTGELCNFRDDWSEFEQAGAKVFGISRDSVWSHKAFKEKEGLKHGLLADMNGEVARLYGAWDEKAGLAERLTVLIDKDGKIVYTTKSANLATPRDHRAVIAALQV